jgi:hypothetical protein
MVQTYTPQAEPLGVFPVLPPAVIGTAEVAAQATPAMIAVVVIVMLAEVANVSFLQLVADIV